VVFNVIMWLLGCCYAVTKFQGDIYTNYNLLLGCSGWLPGWYFAISSYL